MAADLRRPARRRVDRRARPDLEMDGAREPQDLHRVRLHRRDLQGAAHRRRGEALGHPLHHHEGDPDRRRGARRATRARGPDRRAARGRGRQAALSRQGRGRGAAHDRGLPARPRALRRQRRLARRGHGDRLPERVDRGAPRRRAHRDVARPHLRPRRRLRRGHRHGDDPLRPARRGRALPPPEVFLSPKGLEHVGPRAFGYDIDFRSVFAP